MFKNTYVIYIVIIFNLISCSKYDIYQDRKIPSQNTQYLENNNNNIEPYTKTQYGYYGTAVKNDSFYNSLLNPSKEHTPIAIKDEVANNNITKIKKSVKKNIKQNKNLFYLQVGAYSKLKNAVDMQSIMSKYGNTIITQDAQNKTTLNKVKIGPLNTLEQTIKLQKTLKQAGFSQTIITRGKQDAQ